MPYIKLCCTEIIKTAGTRNLLRTSFVPLRMPVSSCFFCLPLQASHNGYMHLEDQLLMDRALHLTGRHLTTLSSVQPLLPPVTSGLLATTASLARYSILRQIPQTPLISSS